MDTRPGGAATRRGTIPHQKLSIAGIARRRVVLPQGLACCQREVATHHIPALYGAGCPLIGADSPLKDQQRLPLAARVDAAREAP
jgi:hypothetical protein